MGSEKPNVLFIFGDQWRAQATGYSGDRNVRTPNLDQLQNESVCFTDAVMGCPVCSPARACMINGNYPLTHGVFMNDLYLRHEVPSIADVYRSAGYDTAYIGKWHLDGHGRTRYIPRERRQGFQFWRVLECTHNYNESYYYADDPVRRKWDGYDAIAQTREATRYIDQYDSELPFLLFLSWGPPHNPYGTAPPQYREMYEPEKLELRPNVPDEAAERARIDLSGYYAHVTAMDDSIGRLMESLTRRDIERDTILLFTSDHGDMHGSQGEWRKQRPWDESILAPLLIRYPGELSPRTVSTPINTPDLMPTLLGLSGVDIPQTVEGLDYSEHMRGEDDPGDGAALIACYSPFGEWILAQGGREFRGVRTERYTYVRDLGGPWLLYDNAEDPYQVCNLCDDHDYLQTRRRLDTVLHAKLTETRDDFATAESLVRRYGIVTDKLGTVPYTA